MKENYKKIQWDETRTNIIIDGICFELKGEGYPETYEFGTVYVIHNYESKDGSTAQTAHIVNDMDVLNDGDLDCCDWQEWEKVDVDWSDKILIESCIDIKTDGTEADKIYEYIDKKSLETSESIDFQPTSFGTNPTKVVMQCVLPVFFGYIEHDGEIEVGFLVEKDEEYDNQNIYQKDRIVYIKAV